MVGSETNQILCNSGRSSHAVFPGAFPEDELHTDREREWLEGKTNLSREPTTYSNHSLIPGPPKLKGKEPDRREIAVYMPRPRPGRHSASFSSSHELNAENLERLARELMKTPKMPRRPPPPPPPPPSPEPQPTKDEEVEKIVELGPHPEPLATKTETATHVQFVPQLSRSEKLAMLREVMQGTDMTEFEKQKVLYLFRQHGRLMEPGPAPSANWFAGTVKRVQESMRRGVESRIERFFF